MIGKWRTKGGWAAEVTEEFEINAASMELLGNVFIGGLEIPTYWDVDGVSTNPDLKLINRFSGLDAQCKWEELKRRKLW